MDIIVTDHALLRYIERVFGFDIELVRKHIENSVRGPAKIGATTTTIDGYVYCLKERGNGAVAVTTILDTDMRAKRYKRHHRNPNEDEEE
jgi:hypothetical protein